MGNLVDMTGLRRLEAPHFQGQALQRDGHAIRCILVCIDHSPFAEACLRHAVTIAKSLGGVITLLHVMDPPREGHGLQTTTDVLDWEVSRQQASAYLERLRDEGTRALGRTVQTRLEQGHPATRIAAVSRELDADLTVLGSQGERGVTAWHLGSTVQQVLAVARGSLLIVRPSSATVDDGLPKNILVPLDGSLRAECVLPTAVRIASRHDAELLLVLVVPEPVATAVLRAPEDLDVARDLAARLERSGKAYLEGLRQRLVHEGTSARTIVLRSADERQSLLELSVKERSDLVVLSAHGSTCNPALTCGSITAHLLAHSIVPLLVIQDLRDSELRGQESERHAPPLRAHCPELV